MSGMLWAGALLIAVPLGIGIAVAVWLVRRRRREGLPRRSDLEVDLG